MVEQQQVTVPSGPAPGGPQRMQTRYLDDAGRYRRSRVPVPTDEFGRLTATAWRCRRCAGIRWVPKGRMKAGSPPPMCEVHERPMRPAGLRGAQLLPWGRVWESVGRPLRPVWALPGLAAAGWVVDAADVPVAACGAVAPLAGLAASRVVRWWQVRDLVARGRLEADDAQAHKRRRAAIDRAARACGYAAAGGAGALAVAAGVGVDDPVAAAAMLAAWLAPAATFWRRERLREAPRQVVEAPPVDEGPRVDPVEVEVRRIWASVLAYRQGDLLGHDRDGRPVRAKRDAKLAGTRLLTWWRVEGGWAAKGAGPLGAYESEQFVKAVGAIASAFSVTKPMVSVTPDLDDENLFEVMVQRTSPITGVIRWAGPDSIDPARGVAPVAVYKDGTVCEYELYRPGWGCPHVAAFGTTGSGKSEFVNLLFTIDRWSYATGRDGQRRGLVADFLIDPQQGQSYGPFLDDLAGPVACSLVEAALLVAALDGEAKRRNRYLAREAKWWDERRKKWRTGGKKAWDPLVDGPILALTIDEAHDYLANRGFAALVTKAARMWRKCGMQIRIVTHTPLLQDLGGNMALRDMLTGGFVWLGRVANSLSGPTALNGRLPVDPRRIPQEPGLAYALSGTNPKPMLARTMWEPDFLDWVRGDDDRPLGYPVVLPARTVAAFGRSYAVWAANAIVQGEWRPPDEMRAVLDYVLPALEEVEAAKGGDPARPGGPSVIVVEAVFQVLADADEPLDMSGLDGRLRVAGVEASTLQVRDALARLRGDGLVFTSGDRRHGLTEAGRERAAAERVEVAA